MTQDMYRRKWTDAPARPVAHPQPQVRATLVPADDERVPPAARRMMVVAEAAGWTVRAKYARGTSMDTRGRPGRVVDDVGLLLTRGGLRIIAHWTDRAFDWAWVVTTRGPLRKVGARELRTLLVAPDDDGDGEDGGMSGEDKP